ncbi:molybdopterin synthase sulfur carrier subunit [Nothobranchius furzeri]
MTAQVTVLFFAKSAELAGLKEEELVAVPTPISSKDLWGLLLRKHPRFASAGVLPMCVSPTECDPEPARTTQTPSTAPESS